MIAPYYEQDGIVIYHGDCRELMESFAGHWGDQLFDLLLTDPPYGIGESRGKNVTRTITPNQQRQLEGGRAPQPTDYGVAAWDDEPCHDGIALARQLARWQLIFGGNYYDLPPSRCWLVWDKDNTGDFADCELVWTNLLKAVRKLTYRWNGMIQQPGRPKELREHPTQKPEAVIVWALTQAPPTVRTVFDPFMGSGTTLVAAKRLGRSAIGIDINERYCEIAARRLAQGALSFAAPGAAAG